MKGINFIEPLFHASVEGRKKKTRRIIKLPPYQMAGWKLYSTKNQNGLYEFIDGAGHSVEVKPRYKSGEIIYLKEPYRVTHIDNIWFINYRYTGDKVQLNISIGNEELEKIIRQQEKSKSGWCNKLYMPQWAARYFAKIKAVRAERLQDISDEDCIKEGITPYCWGGNTDEKRSYSGYFNVVGRGKATKDDPFPYHSETPREAYAVLIDSINGKGTWGKNPYVCVIDYEMIDKK